MSDRLLRAARKAWPEFIWSLYEEEVIQGRHMGTGFTVVFSMADAEDQMVLQTALENEFTFTRNSGAVTYVNKEPIDNAFMATRKRDGFSFFAKTKPDLLMMCVGDGVK